MEAPRRQIILPRALYIAGALLITGLIIYWLRHVFTPIFLAFIIAYILDPVVDRLQAWKVPRPLAIVIVLGGTFGAVVVFLALLLPGIVAEVAGVIQELPRQLAMLWSSFAPWLEQQGITMPHSTQERVERLGASTSEVASSILGEIFGFLGILLALPTAAVAKIFVSRGVHSYRTTELFLHLPSEPPLDHSLTAHEPHTAASDAARGRPLLTPPRHGQRGS